ncbi:MAG: hypothetical protein CMG25_03170 [Candidatus Marinimicrobia bacterium]|nr:hypothetical protein [Candidatus Neomarinimicrobiota bacterium]|tara:strand:+ start:5252 stop:7432 length:2181 start_codon:yes stop_codon:yes gene_type:complete
MYNGSGLPLAQFGGYLGVSGGGGDMYNTYLTRYNVVNNLSSPLSMSLSSDIIGDQINMEVSIDVTGNIDTINNKVVFILSSFQDDDYFCSVINYEYVSFDINTQTYTSSVLIDPNWDINQIKFIALVQSFTNDEILQAGSMSVPLNNLLVMDTQIGTIYDAEGGDGDGVANPGESIDIAVDIINESIELIASSQEVIISTNSDGINIPIQEFSYFESIEPGSQFSALIPMDIYSDISLGNAIFNITINCNYIDNYSNELTFTKTYERSLNINLYQNGFPYILSSQVLTSPAIVDLNQDGFKEIIFGDYVGRLHAVNQFGESILGFPFDLQDQIWGAPSVADIDNDGEMEIIACSKNKKIHIINSDGSQQFSYNTGKYLTATPALGNIDDDEELEIILGSYASPTSSNKLYAINPDGSDVPGFPLTIGEKIKRGAALADFNNNGKADIVFGTDSENIYLVYDDGSIADGFPFEGDGDFRAEPTILDTGLEKMILAATKSGTFYAINDLGEIIFSIETSDDIMVSPSVLSINGDTPIIVFGNDDGYLYAVNIDGSIIEGWPIMLPSDIISSPVFSDFNSDSNPELLVGADNSKLYILNMDGSYYSEPFDYPFPYTGSTLIYDLDSDGDLEVFSGTGEGLAVFDIKELGVSYGYWNIFRGNFKRDGYFRNINYGDLNIDDNIDIFDIIIMVNFILGESESINYEYADINHDGHVDISDIILILNYILLD